MTMTDYDSAKGQALAQLESIQEMVKRLEHAQECNATEIQDCSLEDDDLEALIRETIGWSSSMTVRENIEDVFSDLHNEDAARQAIEEDALSVEVRAGWFTPGNLDEASPSEYAILLCTGGPAVRIIGDLSRYSVPESARIEYQDWGTPWADFPLTREQEQTVLTYCQQFYFGG